MVRLGWGRFGFGGSRVAVNCELGPGSLKSRGQFTETALRYWLLDIERSEALTPDPTQKSGSERNSRNHRHSAIG